MEGHHGRAVGTEDYRPIGRAVCQNPLGWELPTVTMKWGTTVCPVVFCTSTVTESKEVAAWDEEKDATSSRRGGEVKASTDTTTAAAAGTRTASPSGQRRRPPARA